MSADPHDYFQDAVAELRRSQERLRSVRKELQDKATKVTSKDGMVTVVLDGRGEVTSIRFNSTKFRRLAPAELGAVLVDTISRARAEGRDRVMQAFQPLLPERMDIAGLMAGNFSVDKLFDQAVQRGEKIVADGRPMPSGDQVTR